MPDSIDLTESPVKTRKQIEKTNEDSSDNGTDEMIIHIADKLEKTSRKNSNALKKRAKNMKAAKSRTVKMYTVNVERKRILKQRRKQTLQNAKDRKSAKEYFLTASQASRKVDRISKDTQKGKKATMG